MIKKKRERERYEDSRKTFVSKSWPGQQGLGRPLVGTGQSVKGVSEAGGLTTHSCWESSGRELESIPPGWKVGGAVRGEEIPPGNSISRAAVVSEHRWVYAAGLPAGRCVVPSLHSNLSVGVVTPRSVQVGSEGGCLLRAVLIKLPLVWLLPWTDASSAVTSHVSLEGQSHGTPCFTTYHAFSL